MIAVPPVYAQLTLESLEKRLKESLEQLGLLPKGGIINQKMEEARSKFMDGYPLIEVLNSLPTESEIIKAGKTVCVEYDSAGVLPTGCVPTKKSLISWIERLFEVREAEQTTILGKQIIKVFKERILSELAKWITLVFLPFFIIII